MTRQQAQRLADTYNANAPAGVRYEVAENPSPSPRVTPFYMRRVVTRAAAGEPKSAAKAAPADAAQLRLA